MTDRLVVVGHRISGRARSRSFRACRTERSREKAANGGRSFERNAGRKSRTKQSPGTRRSATLGRDTRSCQACGPLRAFGRPASNPWPLRQGQHSSLGLSGAFSGLESFLEDLSQVFQAQLKTALVAKHQHYTKSIMIHHDPVFRRGQLLVASTTEARQPGGLQITVNLPSRGRKIMENPLNQEGGS